MDQVEANGLALRWIKYSIARNVVERHIVKSPSDRLFRLSKILARTIADINADMRDHNVKIVRLPDDGDATNFLRYQLIFGGREEDKTVIKWLLDTDVKEIIRGLGGL